MIPKMDNYLALSEITDAFHTNLDAIELYASQKLISSIPDHSNSKVYSPLDQIRLKFIVNAKNADYSIGSIVKLIGELDLNKQAADQLDDCMVYGKKAYNRLEESLNDLDMLEQINVTCDMELLNVYLNDLNELKYGLNEISSNNHIADPGTIKIPETPISIPKKTKSVKKTQSKTLPAKTHKKSRAKKLLYACTVALIIIIFGYAYFEQPAIIEEQTGGPSFIESSSADVSLNDDAINDTGSPDPADGNAFAKKENVPSFDATESETIASSNLISGLNEKETVTSVQPGKSGEMRDPNMSKDLNELDPDNTISEAESASKLEDELFKKLVSDLTAKYDRQNTSKQPQQKNNQKIASRDTKSNKKEPSGKTDPAAKSLSNSSSSPKKEGQTGDSPKDFSVFAGTTTIVKKEETKTPKSKTSLKKISKTKSSDLAPKKPKPVAPKPTITKKPADITIKAPTVTIQKKTSPTTESETLARNTTAPTIKIESSDSNDDKTLSTAKALPEPIQKPSPQPTNPEALKWVQKSYESVLSGDASEAIISASVAITLDSGSINAFINRSWAYSQKGLFDKAIQDCNKALKLDAKNALAYNNRGLAFQGKGDLEKAKADYQQACQLGFEVGCKNYKEAVGILGTTP